MQETSSFTVLLMNRLGELGPSMEGELQWEGEQGRCDTDPHLRNGLCRNVSSRGGTEDNAIPPDGSKGRSLLWKRNRRPMSLAKNVVPGPRILALLPAFPPFIFLNTEEGEDQDVPQEARVRDVDGMWSGPGRSLGAAQKGHPGTPEKGFMPETPPRAQTQESALERARSQPCHPPGPHPSARSAICSLGAPCASSPTSPIYHSSSPLLYADDDKM
ncbi:hypothetical protein H920_02149 [Fukomys damarensis]|uniref:Uncharacterized protein n=1 Tax=Fukomys damarensis TaxID=885580 RepID=A0A091DZJ8_FUKDA|nr:hypothetical protein H920_02149 [Fukomys damarensis]